MIIQKLKCVNNDLSLTGFVMVREEVMIQILAADLWRILSNAYSVHVRLDWAYKGEMRVDRIVTVMCLSHFLQ